jgi:hypothetical protein
MRRFVRFFTNNELSHRLRVKPSEASALALAGISFAVERL